MKYPVMLTVISLNDKVRVIGYFLFLKLLYFFQLLYTKYILCLGKKNYFEVRISRPGRATKQDPISIIFFFKLAGCSGICLTPSFSGGRGRRISGAREPRSQ